MREHIRRPFQRAASLVVRLLLAVARPVAIAGGAGWKHRSDLLELVGLAAISVGVGRRWGVDLGLVVGGCLLVGYAYLIGGDA